MLKTIERLVKETNMRLGNHRVSTEEHFGKYFKYYWYWDTAICVVNETDNTFETNCGDYDDSPSTTRAINDYRNYHQKNGYAEKFYDLNKVLKYISTLPWNNLPVNIVYEDREVSNVTHKFRIGKVKKDNDYSVDFEYFHGTKSYSDTIGLLRPSRLTKELSKTFERVLND